jgi:hypothetical protein
MQIVRLKTNIFGGYFSGLFLQKILSAQDSFSIQLAGGWMEENMTK